MKGLDDVVAYTKALIEADVGERKVEMTASLHQAQRWYPKRRAKRFQLVLDAPLHQGQA